MKTQIVDYRGVPIDVELEVSQYWNGNLALNAIESDTKELYTEITTNGMLFEEQEDSVSFISIKSDNKNYIKALDNIGFLESTDPFYSENRGFINLNYYKLSEKGAEFCNSELNRQKEVKKSLKEKLTDKREEKQLENHPSKNKKHEKNNEIGR
ncbi:MULTISPECIES: hypothetical protein [Aerococcus]|uniref:DUF4313 domain-containing protein n=1 Tax=Aerococcus tenax TaxID=3078812 RepID=A0A5N1BEJ7_9LACT|nr:MULTISPECIES: hypothetical protein [Aerococcus]KAA9237836.1 hypothetical protein F6I34_09240 [Aerococcus urinae]MDK6371644.1 hypothetical protein [Aerococcus urinae]MDK6597069.1 hypothetical protein [Aerococcus urinae]MDK7802019.1 hypothetical protein [Aerococcus urinae]MDK8655606.1 hypothetical protein [Aerococcus urinae]